MRLGFSCRAAAACGLGRERRHDESEHRLGGVFRHAGGRCESGSVQRRRDGEPQFLGDFEVIQPGPQPGGVRLRLFVLFQQRQEGLRRIPDRRQVHHVVALKLALQFLTGGRQLFFVQVAQRGAQQFLELLGLGPCSFEDWPPSRPGFESYADGASIVGTNGWSAESTDGAVVTTAVYFSELLAPPCRLPIFQETTT